MENEIGILEVYEFCQKEGEKFGLTKAQEKMLLRDLLFLLDN